MKTSDCIQADVEVTFETEDAPNELTNTTWETKFIIAVWQTLHSMSCKGVNRRKLNVNFVNFLMKIQVPFTWLTDIQFYNRHSSWEFVVTPWWYVWLLCMAASWLRWCAFDKNNEIKQAWAGLILEQTIIFGSFLGEHQMSAQSSILSLSASSSTIEILRVKVSCHWSAVIHFLMFLRWHFCVVTIEAYKQLCHCYLYSGFTVKPV